MASLILRAGVACVLAGGCNEPATPPSNTPPDPDYLLRFTAANRQFTVRGPTVGGGYPAATLRVTSSTADPATGMVQLTVEFVNPTGFLIPAPDAVALYAFEGGQGSAPEPDSSCAEFPGVIPASPPGACIRDHRGTAGAEALLSPGEATGPVIWTLTGWTGSDFSFEARILDVLEPGEIAGNVFLDLDGDGVRDHDDVGIANRYVTIVFGDSVHYETVDGVGRFSMQVTAPGSYPVLNQNVDCCTTTVVRRDADILRLPDGSLSAAGPLDFGCATQPAGFPVPVFVDVRSTNTLVPPCTGAEPCTLSTFTPFRIRFTGKAFCRRVTGFQWQGIRPGDFDWEPVQPFGSDRLFLAAGHDTLALAANGDTLWAARDDTVTVYYRASRQQPIPPGNFIFRARVRDSGGVESLSGPTNWRRVAINFDPQTALYAAPACDCLRPPPACEARTPVPIGWITGVDGTVFGQSEWIPFCAGDTLPRLSHVVFYAQGRDDARDVPIDPSGAREAGFSFRFEWRNGGLANLSQPFSTEYPGAWQPLPAGGVFRGGRAAWNPCPFDYEFYASAVDEHGKRDGTPAGLPFYVSGAPALDTVDAPRVFVLVPVCAPNTAVPCPVAPVFGADTVAVQGVWVGGGGAPLALGSNRFTLPVRVTGHDSPLDRNASGRAYYAAGNEGGIRSWRYQFNCLGNCDDLILPGEGQWTNDTAAPGDPPGQQVFDGPLAFTVPLDTLCTTVPCTPGAMRVAVRGAFLGTYEFAVEGRDSSPFQTCPEPSDLGPSPFVFTRPVEGRATGIAGRRVELRALHQIRPAAQSSRRPSTRR